jgi:NADP-dependent 3-hydroxy acid dehydrogenase YdfG
MTKVCAILGVGPGNGRSFARKFSAGGYKVALCARTEPHINDEVRAIGDTARGYVMDVTDDRSVQDGFAAITQKQGPADTLIYNAGTAVWGNVDKIAPADLLPGFDVNAAGLIRAVQATLPAMRKAGRGISLWSGRVQRFGGVPTHWALLPQRQRKGPYASHWRGNLDPKASMCRFSFSTASSTSRRR